MYANIVFGGNVMLQTGVAEIQSVAAELSLYEKSISSAKVILTGFVVVFAMLFLLILIIKIYGAIVSGVQNAADRKRRTKEKVVESLGTATVVQKPAYVTAPTIEAGIPDEVIAVIAAAVEASCEPNAKTRIKSIKTSNGGRSAWANAGVLDNTRPF